MEVNSGLSFSHTADYTFIDVALKAQWRPFCDLVQEVESFVPRTDVSEHRRSELSRLQKLNPSSADEELLRLIDGQIRAHADPGLQFSIRFNDRIMAEYVTVAFLAHALAEAVINAILASVSARLVHMMFSPYSNGQTLRRSGALARRRSIQDMS